MKPHETPGPTLFRRTRVRLGTSALAFWLLLPAQPARASFLHGEALDTLADVMSWVVLLVAPIICIALFWVVHILPEKIAEKRRHPQAKAIQCLCLLSLAFGGLLWPLAFLWAYSKPVLHKLAYGTDVSEEPAHDGRARATQEAQTAELQAKIAHLEKKLAGVKASLGGEG